MKKVFLTAVAVVAFSSFGNANYKQFDSNSIFEDVDECLDLAIKIYNGTIARGKTHEYALELAEWSYNDCQNW